MLENQVEIHCETTLSFVDFFCKDYGVSFWLWKNLIICL